MNEMKEKKKEQDGHQSQRTDNQKNYSESMKELMANCKEAIQRLEKTQNLLQEYKRKRKIRGCCVPKELSDEIRKTISDNDLRLLN